MREIVVMLATSYPRFPGDGVGSFIEPIAKGIAARGHEVHLVAPWHPVITRGREEDGVFFHFYRYAPAASMNVFGYAQSLRADTQLRLAALVVTPPALALGCFKAMRVAQKRGATVIHAHWAIPGGVMGLAAGGRLPLVVSLHGSDVYVAERYWVARQGARLALRAAGWVTACSEDLRQRALRIGARASRSETVPYGVDTERFRPDANVRAAVRRELGIGDAPLLFAAGRLVRKKGFEFLLAAMRELVPAYPDLRLLIAGEGDLRAELAQLAAPLGRAVILLGRQDQERVGQLAAAADLVIVPSVHDQDGNVDGLPNFALEALATATPVVATRVGGLPDAIQDGVTGRLVPERDGPALAAAIRSCLADPAGTRGLGLAARERVSRDFGWPQAVERFEAAYERARR